MSSTIQAIITEAFQTIGVVADGRQPTPSQSQVGLTLMNDRILSQTRDGWRLGWFPQTNVAATAPLRDEDIGEIKLCLAAWLAPKYGVTIAPAADPNDEAALSNQIKNAFRLLTKRSILYTECDLGELSRPQGGPWGGPNWL
jgi:hypothetical protein